jgi:hypothetical protein
MLKIEHIVEMERSEDGEAIDLNSQVWQRSFSIPVDSLDDQALY